MKNSKETPDSVVKNLNKSTNAKLINLSRPLFIQTSGDKLSGEEMHTDLETSSQLIAESGSSRPYKMRFRMNFIYPAVKRDPNDKTVPIPITSSQDFNDNFDIINLTQMLESTTAEAFANEEPTQDFLEVTVGENKENEEFCIELSPPEVVSTTPVRPSYKTLNPDDEFNNSIKIDGCNQVEKNVQNAISAELQPIPQKSVGNGNDYQKTLPTYVGGFPGFKTASGITLTTPSEESLKNAKRLLEEMANSDIQGKSPSDAPVRDDKPMKSAFGFTAASGTILKVPSSESLARAKRLVKDCNSPEKESDGTCFSTNADSGILPPSFTRTLSEPKIMSGGSSAHIESIRPNVDLKGGFKTATGKNLKTPSIKSIEFAKRLFEGTTEKFVFNSMNRNSNESPGSTSRIQALKAVSVKQSKGALEPSTLAKDPLTTGFTTGSGRTLKLSSIESLKRSKELIDVLSEEPPTVVMDQGRGVFKAALGKSLNPVSEGAIKRVAVLSNEIINEPFVHSLIGNEISHSTPSGFKSASGKAINPVSDEAIKRATVLFNECSKDVKIGLEEPTISNTITPSFVGGSCKSASGKTINLDSEVAMKRATAEETETVEESMASNKTISLVGSGFKPVSGKSITLVSNTAMQRTTALTDECANETEGSELDISAPKSPSLEISSSPSRKGDHFELSPVLDFDGSFEISSQMMNVLEGKISQPQRSTQSQLIEGQRLVLRAEQESKAEPRFKPIDTSNRSSSRINSHSVSSRSSHLKSHQVIHEPSAPGLLWKCRKNGGRSVRDFLTPFSGPVVKEFNFADDFLRLNDLGPFSLNTASDLRFKVDSEDLHVSYLLGDDVEIIPDSLGYVGCEEVVRAFVCSPGVTSGLATRQWIAHHFCQLAWRFGSTALLHYDSLVRSVCSNLTLPDSSMERTDGRLLLHALLLELKYRYDRELEAVQRPAIRKILERDDTSAKRMVLCVSHLESLPNHQYRGRLTDGWYHIDWVPDPLLTRLIERGRIRVGTKLATAGAELVQAPSGFGGNGGEKVKGEDAHLFGESSNGLALRLNGNSTVPAPPNARLGFASRQPMAHLPSIPLSSISSDGGAVSSVCVLIQKRFQLQYMETCSPEDGEANETDGSRKQHVFRDPRSEQVAERKHAEKCQRAFDKAVGEFTSSKGRRGRRSQPKTSFLNSLGLDGEALWNAVNNALDPGLAEGDLSAAQRDAMLRYKETAMQEILSESISKREVTQLLRLQVAGIHPQDVRRHCELPLTLWNPTEEMLEVLREGSVVQLTRLHVSTTRCTDPFASLSLSATENGQLVSLSGSRGTSVRPLKATQAVKFFKQGQSTDTTSVQDLIEAIYRPKNFFSVGELGNVTGEAPDRTKCVDFTALVIGTKTTTSASTNTSGGGGGGISASLRNSDLGVVYLASLRGEDGEEDFSTIAVLRIWGGLERYCLNSVLSARNRVRFTDVQLKNVNKFQTDSDFPHGGSPTVNCVLLNYTAASYVTTETAPRDVSVNRRFKTPWKETPQFYSYMQACMESHFQKFFSGTSSATISASRYLRSSIRFESPLSSTSKTDSISVPSSVVNAKEQSSIIKTEASFGSSSASRIRTRTGLCRPRKSISAALAAASTPNTSLVLNASIVRDEVPKPSPSAPSAFSTPLPAKRQFSTKLDKMGTSGIPSTLEKSSPIAKRRRSTLFASSIPIQSVRTSPKLETPNSPGLDQLVVSPNFDSDTESTEPQRTNIVSSEGINSNIDHPSRDIHSDTVSTEPQKNDSPSLQAISHVEPSLVEADSSALFEDVSSSLDVSIADLVKTRRRKCNSQTSSPAPTRRKPLNLESTQ